MHITESMVKTLKIWDVPDLDPVTVSLDDLGDGRGNLTLECFGKSWAYYWGAMGKNRSLSDFILSANNPYLIGKLDPYLEAKVPDVDQVGRDAEDKDVDFEPHHLNCPDKMHEIYGEDFWYTPEAVVPHKDNPDYLYLVKILDTVKEALRQVALEKS